MTSRVRLPGVVVAGVTAVVSGVSIFVNSYGVHAVRDAAVYTTAKNLVATGLLAALAAGAWAARPRPAIRSGRRLGPAGWVALAYVGVAGGGIAFVLFFQGLAGTPAAPAAFLHDTLVMWVALLAAMFLAERPSGWNLAAIAFLVGGEVAATGGIGRLVADRSQLLVLVATLLWSVETVLAKPLLRSVSPHALALVRMGIGSAVLVGYLLATSAFTGPDGLTSLGAGQWGWALATGALLACYVATWMVALSRARAVDVTSVLVGSLVVTSLLGFAAGRSVSLGGVAGLVLVGVGTLTVLLAWPRRKGTLAVPVPVPGAAPPGRR